MRISSVIAYNSGSLWRRLALPKKIFTLYHKYLVNRLLLLIEGKLTRERFCGVKRTQGRQVVRNSAGDNFRF